VKNHAGPVYKSAPQGGSAALEERRHRLSNDGTGATRQSLYVI
jgi:hypothetical protein